MWEVRTCILYIHIYIYTCMIFSDSWPSEEGERIVSECYSTRYVELLPFLFAFVSPEGGRDLMSQQLCLLHGYAANSKVSTWNQGRWNEQRKYRSKECVNMLIFGKDTTIWNHWSCSIDTRLHRRKCEVLDFVTQGVTWSVLLAVMKVAPFKKVQGFLKFCFVVRHKDEKKGKPDIFVI